MNDFFYFPRRTVDLEGIRDELNSFDFPEMNLVDNWMGITYGDAEHDRWELGVFELSELSLEDRNQMVEEGYGDGFYIAHYSISIPILVPVFRKLLEAFGGFVGKDVGSSEPRFDIENIEQLNYPRRGS